MELPGFTSPLLASTLIRLSHCPDLIKSQLVG